MVPEASARSPVAIACVGSVRLFVERAWAVVPGFAIDATNAIAVRHIVRRLGGLPVAIELAAALVKLHPTQCWPASSSR
jgi:predicted ATPase